MLRMNCRPTQFPIALQTANRNQLLFQHLALEHLDACVALDKQSLGGVWSRKLWIEELAPSYDNAKKLNLGLWLSKRLVAVACGRINLDELEITFLAVAEDQRRCGYGRISLQILMKHARVRGARRAVLEVSSSNHAALGLYRTIGFQAVGIRRGYYRNGEDALLQWIDINEFQ